MRYQLLGHIPGESNFDNSNVQPGIKHAMQPGNVVYESDDIQECTLIYKNNGFIKDGVWVVVNSIVDTAAPASDKSGALSKSDL